MGKWDNAATPNLSLQFGSFSLNGMDSLEPSSPVGWASTTTSTTTTSSNNSGKTVTKSTTTQSAWGTTTKAASPKKTLSPDRSEQQRVQEGTATKSTTSVPPGLSVDSGRVTPTTGQSPRYAPSAPSPASLPKPDEVKRGTPSRAQGGPFQAQGGAASQANKMNIGYGTGLYQASYGQYSMDLGRPAATSTPSQLPAAGSGTPKSAGARGGAVTQVSAQSPSRGQQPVAQMQQIPLQQQAQQQQQQQQVAQQQTQQKQVQQQQTQQPQQNQQNQGQQTAAQLHQQAQAGMQQGYHYAPPPPPGMALPYNPYNYAGYYQGYGYYQNPQFAQYSPRTQYPPRGNMPYGVEGPVPGFSNPPNMPYQDQHMMAQQHEYAGAVPQGFGEINAAYMQQAPMQQQGGHHGHHGHQNGSQGHGKAGSASSAGGSGSQQSHGQRGNAGIQGGYQNAGGRDHVSPPVPNASAAMSGSYGQHYGWAGNYGAQPVGGWGGHMMPQGYQQSPSQQQHSPSMDVGARVWVADPADERVWLAARVLEVCEAAVSVELEDQRTEEQMASRFTRRGSYDDREDDAQAKRRDVTLSFTASGECANVLPRNMPREQDQRDLVALPHLHEASILNALRLRYERHAIYTHIGDILISINPFQNLPQLYGDEVLQGYAYDHNAQFGDRITATDTREPHLFAVARAAYMDIVLNGRSQAILISGESGAGKTEATKIIMTYFAVTCGTGNNNLTGSTTETGQSNSPPVSPSRTTIEEQVLQSNPILEAFGNARTVRNDNSSRFGKFIELRFRDKRRKLAGARIRTYLLEKIRVIKQAPHERNFHIFYELLSADNKCVSKEQKQALALSGGPQSFRLLNQSLCSKRRDGVKDGVQFRSTKRAMQQLGMSEKEIGGVLEIVAAVLHMGNVDFEQIPHKREDNVFADEARVVTSTDSACDHFTKAAELLGVSTEALDHALTKRWLHASNETLVVGVDVAHARNTRNALTMECYRLLFEWLVARVNNKLQRQATPWDADQSDDDEDEDSNDFIGLLDIFGFEDMAENSFEQLCINYANEALQHQFNQYIFEEEQRLYRDEGIRWSFVDFPNNRACLELFEHRPIGIFSLTDQECVFPQGTDRALVAKYYLEFEKKTQHPHFRSASVIQRTTQFVVAHYAGCVTYTVDGFLAKNKDSFCESAAQLLAGSSNPLIQALAAGSANEDGATADSDLDGYGGRNIRRAKSAIAAVSVGTQFKIQLNQLLTTVRATTPRNYAVVVFLKL
ncbi:Myosin-like protein [Phytophthora palmivora]|uniref:Myosin-like protein n=1 Tax=Phytophthora palmivora TaxID=4796 RepID=A0A2P4XZD4_9STRA|nr:Myosin-like protein [Phytophthora palmivora]